MYEVNDVFTAETIKNLLAPLLEKGFTFEYTHEKGGDSSCVYIGRFRKGKDFFDWREVSGGDEINFVAKVDGQYRFPSLKHLIKRNFVCLPASIFSRGQPYHKRGRFTPSFC